jgi:predicted acetyltransferase
VFVTIRDALSSPADRDWIRSVYRDYLSEMSSSRTGVFPVLGEWAARENEFLASWFTDASSHPFVILDGHSRTGFALVTQPSSLQRGPVQFLMAEFFVTREARRKGVGAAAAGLLFSRFSGDWEVREDEHNRAALQFWRRVIGRLTGGRFSETRTGGEVRHRFRIEARPAARDVAP